MKPEDVNIIQIVINGVTTIGLGDDSQVYRWIDSQREWAL